MADAAKAALIKECRVAWQVVRPNKHNKVDRKRLLKALHFMGKDPTLKLMHDYCHKHGANVAFTFEDLLTLAEKCPHIRSDELIEAFNLIDVDGNKNLSRKELKEALTKYGEHLTDSELEQVFALFDADDDGGIDYSEFVDMMMRFLNQIGRLRPGQRQTDMYDPVPSDILGSADLDMEPSDLKDWDCDRLGGAFQAIANNAVMSERFTFRIARATAVYLSLRPKRGSHTPDVDAMFCLLSLDGSDDGTMQFICESNSSLQGHAHIRTTLEPGRYVVVPFSSGCKLRKRAKQPRRRARLIDNGKLTSEAEEALGRVFRRFDLNDRGGLSRHEYDLLLTVTDGEPCDDETWGFMKEQYGIVSELKLEGFLTMYRQMADAERDDDIFYENFESVGLNRALEQDEVCPFVLFAFTEKPGVLRNFEAHAFNAELLRQCLTLLLDSTGEAYFYDEEQLTLLQYRQPSLVLLGVFNEGEVDLDVEVDCSGSDNVCTNRNSLCARGQVKPGQMLGIHHLIPDDVTQPWIVRLSVG